VTGPLPAQQGPFGVAAGGVRPLEKTGGRETLRVDDSPRSTLGRPLPHRVNPNRDRRQNHEQDQAIDSRVAPATLLEASLIAAALIDADEARFAPPPLRAGPWQPPSSSLTLRDRTV